LNLEEATSQLKRVDRALAHISAYLAVHLDDVKGAAKRKHPRYERRELVARFSFTVSQFIPKDRVFMAKVQDVSAGGMCMLVPANTRIRLKDQFNFVVLKSESQVKVIGGQGRVVRIEEAGEQLSIGVQFSQVVNG
jgi:c-di-GMP-binding flagellar brake protein YcgR